MAFSAARAGDPPRPQASSSRSSGGRESRPKLHSNEAANRVIQVRRCQPPPPVPPALSGRLPSPDRSRRNVRDRLGCRRLFPPAGDDLSVAADSGRASAHRARCRDDRDARGCGTADRWRCDLALTVATAVAELGLDGRRGAWRSRSSCCRSFSSTWLAFFLQAIPSFPPQGYSLKWFFSIAENPRFVDGFCAQPASRGHRDGHRRGDRRAGRAVRRALPFLGPRAARQPAAAAARRSRHRARHLALRVPCRGDDPDRAADPGLDRRPGGGTHPARHPVERAPGQREPRRVRPQHRGGGAESRRHAGDDVLSHHAADHPAGHRRGGAVRLRGVVRQSRDVDVPGRRRPHDACRSRSCSTSNTASIRRSPRCRCCRSC